MDVFPDPLRGTGRDNPPGAQRLRVLLIEDSPLIREAVTELVESGGSACRVAAVDSEAAAIAELEANRYDVVIVDLKLREGSGFGVLRALQDLRRGALPIVFTNFATPAIRKRCAELGAIWCFDKSSEFDEIGELIARQASQHGPGHP